MLRNIPSKIFLCFLLCFFIFVPSKTYAIAESEFTKGVASGKCTQTFSSSFSLVTNYKCEGKDYVCNRYLSGRDCQDASPSGCNVAWNFDAKQCMSTIFGAIFSGILKVINWFLSYILWIASLAFDFIVYFTVAKFKTNFGNLQAGGLGTAVFGTNGEGLIYMLWGMIRDFLNILIFLTIIYAAVQSMFEGFENTRKKFISLLVFSIVANFSLLFVKVAIDISNILALQAYTLAVKPKGVNSFSDFRTSSIANGPSSYSEYIMNSVDLNDVVKKGVGTIEAQAEIENLQSTFMFQLGKMITMIGIIYILFFMCGLLLTRALVLLLSMILSPLIAADLFFKMVDKDDKLQAIAKGVRNITEKIRGDFYDSLLKGPLLIFFLFMIGVLAESILSQGVISKMQTELGSMTDVKLAGPIFLQSIFVFFKFVLFFFLTQLLFNMLNNIKINGNNNSGSRLGKFGGNLANYAFGRGVAGLSRAGGAIGRNTIGRAANGNGRFGGFLNDLDNNKTIAAWKSSENRLKNGLGNAIGGATKALRGGTYDARNSNLLGKNLGGKLGDRINRTVRGIADPDKKDQDYKNISVGEARKLGFQEAIEERTKKSTEEMAKAIKEAGKDFRATKEEIDAVKADTKIKDSDLTVSKLEEFLSNPDFKKQLIENPQSIDLATNGISPSDLKILAGAANKDPDILNKIQDANKQVSIKAEKKVEARRDKERERIIDEAKKTLKPDSGILDRNKRTGSNYAELLGDALTGNRGTIQESAVVALNTGISKDVDSKNKEGIKKQIKKYSVASEVQRDLIDNLSEVETTLKLRAALTPEQLADLTALRSEIESSINTLNIPEGKVDEVKRKEIVDRFDDALRSKVLKDKKTTAEILANIYSKKESPELIRKLSFARDELQDELSAIENSKPDPAGKTPSELFAANKVHAKDIRETRKRFEMVDGMLKGGYSNAQKISENLDRLKEKIDANFNEPKPEPPKTTP